MPTFPQQYDGAEVVDNDQQEEFEFRYSDDEIARIIRDEIHSSHTDWETSISIQRENSHRYYYGELPDAPQTNRSQHVSREVFDTVETFKAKMVRTFTENQKVVNFPPLDEQDIEQAEVATKYVNSCFYKHNDGVGIITDAAHDAALLKQCIIKCWWDIRYTKEYEILTDLPREQLNMLLAQPDVEVSRILSEETKQTMMQTPQGPVPQIQNVVTVEVVKLVDNSKVRVEVIPPEDFYVDGSATNPYEANFQCQRSEMTASELVEDGYDPDLIETIGIGDSLEYDFEQHARHSFDDSWRWNKKEGENERRIIHVYEAYLRLDMDDDDEAELWQIIMAGDTVIHKQRVDEMPYFFFSPIRISHKAIGMSYSDVTMDLQRSITSIIRGGIDNVWLTNTTRLAANLEIIRNPRDVLDNPIGAIIDTPSPQDIVPVPTAQLNPATFQVLETLQVQKESRTGDTRMAKGLQNEQIISHQNAEDMINALMNVGNEKIMTTIRRFAEECFKPLLRRIYTLGIENGQIVSANVGGQMQQINPQGWQPREDLIVETALTPEEQQKEAMLLMGLDRAQKEDPELGVLYGIKEKYALWTRVHDLLGVTGSAFLGNPQNPEVQQRIQKVEAEREEEKQFQMQLMVKQAQAGEKMASTGERMASTAETKAMVESQVKIGKLELETEVAKDEQRRKDGQFTHEIMSDKRDGGLAQNRLLFDINSEMWDRYIDTEELVLEKRQERPVALGVNSYG
jgi:hypothetical protein